MKLRNKKTGLDGELHYEPDKEYHFTVATEDPADMAIYRTLAELSADWEDYTPAEPLIKDEKIRKAVRAWAEAESEDCYYGQDATTLYNGSGDHIEFWSRPFKDLTPYEHYTIAELCGEEEE